MPSEAIYPQQVVLRIKRKMRQRFVEWLGAFQLAFIGMIFMDDARTLDSPVFTWMVNLFDERVWTSIFLTVGFGRLIGLIVNGSMQAVTVWIRFVGAVAGFMCFFMIAISMLYAYVILKTAPPISMGMYIPAIGAEIAAMFISIQDARMHQNAAKHT